MDKSLSNDLFTYRYEIRNCTAQPGRPRAFDPDVALDRAMHVFWAKGYEGAALSDLTQAMRINRPSLYAAFGNKEQLFRKVLDRYASGPLAYFGKALAGAKGAGCYRTNFIWRGQDGE